MLSAIFAFPRHAATRFFQMMLAASYLRATPMGTAQNWGAARDVRTTEYAPGHTNSTSATKSQIIRAMLFVLMTTALSASVSPDLVRCGIYILEESTIPLAQLQRICLLMALDGRDFLSNERFVRAVLEFLRNTGVGEVKAWILDS